MLFRLLAIPNLHVFVNASLAGYTRFEIGGPARALLDVDDETALIEAWRAVKETGWQRTVIGGGTNLVVADDGFPGAVIRYTARNIEFEDCRVRVDAGAMLQHLVDATIAQGLRGLETMTGIPGWLGGAVYGNAGAYGRSINEAVESVRFFDGAEIREIDNTGCDFHYRESVFKRRKDWIILSATLRLERGHADDLRAAAASILKIRNAKYPPTMRCAGSIFKNLLLADLNESVKARVPEGVIREGKVPSAFFLEQVGAKGMTNGPIQVADYHANLIYNTGGGTAHQVRAIINELKARVRVQFGIDIQEEVQFVGDSDVQLTATVTPV
ncbi:MAG TPA: UDP-N-acetylmuramate dehydrogenase [Bryobacteraceae bacterium]|nr:UDP-N-acetylmuramate dehydrogenase [Bryobacteraceae bacterium]